MKTNKSIWIKELEKGQRIEEYFAISQLATAKKKSGEYYLRFTLSDKTGQLEARVWDGNLLARMEKEAKDGDIVLIKAVVAEYGGLQLHVDNFWQVERSMLNEEDFRPFTPKDLGLMWDEAMSAIEKVSIDALRELLLGIYNENRQGIIYCVAGKRVHHNYGGGLLEHTLEVLDYCKIAAKHQPKINKDILVAGALLHDIGKLFEYDCQSVTYDNTLRGKLLGGHIVLGRDFIRENYPQDFPEELGLALEHLILSHHGFKEWGAVEEPKTIEAVALHCADLLSARVNQAGLILKDVAAGEWSSFDKFLGTSLYYGNKRN